MMYWIKNKFTTEEIVKDLEVAMRLDPDWDEPKQLLTAFAKL
jgi:hypothetical protein